MKVIPVTDPAFRQYGKVLSGYDYKELAAVMEKTPLPDDVVYVPGLKELEETVAGKELGKRFFGGLPIQIGYCNGHNKLLNAVEYHRNSEINIAMTDMIVMVGHLWDVQDLKYDTSLVEAFLIPAGTGFEFYATTLHYAPCGVGGNGFKAVVVLPKGTNEDLEERIEKPVGEDSCLFAKNKWLIAHADAKIEGAVNGLVGENLSVD